MLTNPDFNNGQGLEIHIRTKMMKWWSFIESAAIKIGNDILEVKSGIQDRQYWVNGLEGAFMKDSGMLASTIGGFNVRFRVISDNVIHYKIFLPDSQLLVIKSVKDMLRIELFNSKPEDFENSVGLLGHYGSGDMVARDRETILEDTDEFGQEWQVREPTLFHEVDGPQFPDACTMPDPVASAERRRLGSSISREDAEKACAHARSDEINDCVYDGTYLVAPISVVLLLLFFLENGWDAFRHTHILYYSFVLQ
jgi:hypothetical protein